MHNNIVEIKDHNNGVRTVLTEGYIAKATGNRTNDMAVYIGNIKQDGHTIARAGLKLSYKQALSMGYDIKPEHYRK